MNWSEFKADAPELAALAEERMERTGLVLVGTVRRDGTPRMSPLEPMIVGDELMLGMIWRSLKAEDLLRDPRALVQTTVRDRLDQSGEVKLRGRVSDVPDAETRERFCDAVEAKIDWRPKEPFHLFAMDIEEGAFIAFQEDGTQVIRRWRPGRYTEERRTLT